VIGHGSARNFIGCIRSLYVNTVNILQRLHSQPTAAATRASISASGHPLTDVNGMRVYYGDVGWPLALRRPNFGCHNLALSAVRLTRPGALMQLPHHAVSDSFNFRMSFATVKPDGVLVSTRVEDSSSLSTRGVVQVSHFFRCCHPKRIPEIGEKLPVLN